VFADSCSLFLLVSSITVCVVVLSDRLFGVVGYRGLEDSLKTSRASGRLFEEALQGPACRLNLLQMNDHRKRGGSLALYINVFPAGSIGLRSDCNWEFPRASHPHAPDLTPLKINLPVIAGYSNHWNVKDNFKKGRDGLMRNLAGSAGGAG
jgi:hypothetical protein